MVKKSTVDKGPFSVRADEVYALTERGNAQLRQAGTRLSADELALLVLVDGTVSVAQIERSAKGQSPEQVRAKLAALFAGELIDFASRVGREALEAGDFFSITVPLKMTEPPSAENKREAKDGVSALNQKGYYVRIARASGMHTRPEGRKPVLFVIDDDEDLVRLLSSVFRLEGFVICAAGDRAGISAVFREHPVPDLVLLDVVMPDIDGFEILGRMRTHETLKRVPVIMLTAEATREAVLKGLHLGADGYITKPFDIEGLTTAVKTVLG